MLPPTSSAVAHGDFRCYETQSLFSQSFSVSTTSECQSVFKFDPRIASSRMLLATFSPMIGSVPSNWFGGVYGENDQHGRAARGVVGGDGALPVGQERREGAHPRRSVRDNKMASQACGARTPATRKGWGQRS